MRSGAYSAIGGGGSIHVNLRAWGIGPPGSTEAPGPTEEPPADDPAEPVEPAPPGVDTWATQPL